MNNSVMKVKILSECGFDEAMLAIAMNKKKYERDMYPVSKKLAVAGSGHSKFLEFIHCYIDYTTCRSIHQQIDTYRVGVTKSSESTHHMLIEDVLESCIDRKYIAEEFKRAGFIFNTEKCSDGLPPINNTALLISKLSAVTNEILKKYGIPLENRIETLINLAEYNVSVINLLQEYADKYLAYAEATEATKNATVKLTEGNAAVLSNILIKAFAIDYEKYYTMFEGGSESITKDTVDKMVNLAMTLEEDRYGKLHKLKRMLPEGFLQRRIMSCNYQVLRHMIEQRFCDPFIQWRIFCFEILTQVKHPEYFVDILEKHHTTIEELRTGKCNGKLYGPSEIK